MTADATNSDATEAAPRRDPRKPLLWGLGKWLLAFGVVAVGLAWVFLSPTAVESHAAARGDVVAEVMGTGTLEARISANITPKISGRIVEVLVDQGDRVEAGQVLFRLDDSDLKRQVEIADNTLISARRAVERQRADVSRATAAQALARIEYRRVEELIPTDSATSIEMNRVTESLHMAEAELARSEAGLAEATSQVEVASSTVDYQRARLADTVVTAPFGGLIVQRDRDAGAVVVPGTSVLLLLSLDELWIRAWVDETEMTRLASGQPARVVFRSEPERSYPGHVVRLGREADRETREFIVDVGVEALPENWAVGQRAEVFIETARAAGALTVPSRTIVWRDGRAGAFVAVDGRATWRELRLGVRGGEAVEVQAGLVEGEKVVSTRDGTVNLRDGQRVSVP